MTNRQAIFLMALYPLLGAMAIGLAVSCKHLTAEDALRGGLSTFAAVVDPAYAATMNACTAKEQAIVAKVKRDGYRPAYQSDFDVTSEQCGEARRVFEAIRTAHDEAAKFVESGKLRALLKEKPP